MSRVSWAEISRTGKRKPWILFIHIQISGSPKCLDPNQTNRYFVDELFINTIKRINLIIE